MYFLIPNTVITVLEKIFKAFLEQTLSKMIRTNL